MDDLTRRCPNCDEERSYYLAASTTMHLGVKKKWCCPECGHKFVRIDGEVDTGEAA